MFGAFSVFAFEWYLFQLIANLNHDFNCCNSFALSSVDKVTNGTENFVSVIDDVAVWFAAALDITQFPDLVRMRLISQLINSISRVLQKLLKYFNGKIISIFFVLSFLVESVIFCLNSNEALLPGKLATAP